jgi:GNAT superfamily N-acetyltransferase
VPAISDGLRALAEEPNAVGPPPTPPARRVVTPSYVVGLAPTPTQTYVSAIRTTAGELDRTIEEIRGVIREAGHTRAVWHVGPSCRPEGLEAALVARGFLPPTEPPFEPELTAMALFEPPPRAPSDVEARIVRDFDEYLETMRIAVATMGDGDGDEGGWLAAARTMWDAADGIARLTHVALIGGQLVGFAWAFATPMGLMLNGGAVRPEWRGRGAYRALVAARWDTAVRLGTPALAIQAGEMSRPILERCGFKVLCRVAALLDPELS